MRTFLASAVALGIIASAGTANATLTYTIWNDANDPGGLLAFRTATFPVPTTDLFASFTSTVEALNFQNNAPNGSPNTFAQFFGGANAGFTPPLSAAQLATPMSTLGDQDTTFIRITETYHLNAPMTSTFSHDDGGAIYIDGAGNGAQLCGTPGEANETTQTCTFAAGTHTLTLLYTEDNGSPADLVVNLPPEAVPEPASLALLGFAIAGLGAFARRRKNG